MSEEEANPLPDHSVKAIWLRYRVAIILLAVSVFFIAVSLTLLVKSIQTTTPITFSRSVDEASVAGFTVGTDVLIAVDVEGAVARPGVYKLPRESRMEEAIKLAGGLTDQADTDTIAKTINLASKLIDGAKIYIPKVGDTQSDIVRRESSSSNPSDPSYPSFINVNTGSQSELESLPGIGPVTAGKIISGRPYQTLTELVTKKAMSQSLFDKLKDSLAL